MLYELGKSNYVCDQTGFSDLMETNASEELLNKAIDLVVFNQNKDKINLREVNEKVAEILKLKNCYVGKVKVETIFIK